MARIDSLFPIPGSKRGSKYNFLAPLPNQDRMSEPFAGGASKSLITALPTIIGDICPAHREIALAPTTKTRARVFTAAYNEARAYLRGNLPIEVLHGYRRVKQAQKQLRKDCPDMAAGIDGRWLELRDRLFHLSPTDPELPGLYACLQRAAFGNVMRLNPRGTNYNSSWHVDKLTNALRFDPAAWVEGLRNQGWDPWVEDSWQATIAAVKHPAKTYLLLDPPYWCDGTESRMTPCYPGHKIGTHGAHDYTFNLAVQPLEMAMRRGFPWIQLCNYDSDRLDSAVQKLAFQYGYQVAWRVMGACGALGNSNGRHKHGDRKDKRKRPVEVVWEFAPVKQLALF